jgi:hypothetical protein
MTREAQAATSRMRPNLQSIRAPHGNTDAVVTGAAVPRQRQVERRLTQPLPGLSDVQAYERRWRCRALSTDPPEPQAYQKRSQRAREKKAQQVKQCRLPQQRERDQGGPVAGRQKTTIHTCTVNREDGNACLHTYGRRKSPVIGTRAPRGHFPSIARTETRYRNQCTVGWLCGSFWTEASDVYIEGSSSGYAVSCHIAYAT